MKIFLSALENAPVTAADIRGDWNSCAEFMVKNGIKMKWNLLSYYYIQKNCYDLAEYIKDNSEEILIDSGAHSFQFGTKVDFMAYTKEYAKFIEKYDSEKVVGFFEMDIENVVGMDKVLRMRKILENVSDKIIPVWHPDRGIKNYYEMCEEYAGRVVAIGGFRGTDIKDEQYLMFLKVARKYGCKVHCLGMTRKDVLDKVPFDYTDSSSWSQTGIFGKIDGKGKVTKEFGKVNRELIWAENYKSGIKMQERYYNKWKTVCGD